MSKYYLNLQLFAGEKTEKATPKRRQEARKKGQVLKSSEVNSALVLLAAFGIINTLLISMIERWENFSVRLWNNLILTDFSLENIVPVLSQVIYLVFSLLLPILLIIFVVAVAANLIQVGFLFSTEALTVKLSRINPLEGLKRIFSKKALVELAKATAKILLLAYVAYSTIKKQINSFSYLMDMEIKSIIGFLGEILFTIMWKVVLILIFLGLIDYLYQKYEYESSLKMSKQEIKDEYKNIEGDPLIKSRIREKQRQMAMHRMMQSVPEADVVITNPTHFAVAIKYDAKVMDAPVVIAKGKNLIALKIKEIAQDSGVVIVENKPLAQTLYHSVDINEQIPEHLFQAVAEVLAFVYRLKGKV
ncbi:MAG: flagellar biosynthesis protein FlhB [Clostridia bacterium]|nr:flagellar biosynthesis protein FlhB [Clostridia bacterium]